ncbi:MAG: tetratricopeptide repeat protein [Verrucomicrobiia bacterium]
MRLSLDSDPLRAEAHFLLALLLARDGDLDQAIVGFKQAMTLEPSNAAARYNLGTALLRRSEAVVAAQMIEDALALRADHVPSYNNLGKAYFLAGIPELAVASYQEALRRDPVNSIARRNLAVLTSAIGGEEASQAGGLRKSAAATGVSQPLISSRRDDVAAVPLVAFPDGTGELPADGVEAEALRELLRGLRHVTVERRGGQLALEGWTSGPNERKLLERILAGEKDVLDLTTDDAGDPHRLLEVDATLFKVIGIDSQTAGHNFLRRVEVNASVSDGALAAFNWLYTAAISYDVNIANASVQRIAFLARPHLTTLSGTPASFVAGGDIVYKVSGTTSGDIKPYPFGTTLDVTPTLLRTQGEDGSPRVRLTVKAGRRTLLPLVDVEGAEAGSTVFENISVTSEAVLGLNQTLILTGLNQREQRTRRSGVPGLKSIPIIKYLFSEKVTTTSDLAIIILLTPRDPAFWDEQNKKATAQFVEKRRAYMHASNGTEEDMRRFKERYPDWDRLAPNRFASHFFLMENSDAYRRVSGMDLASEDFDFSLLGKPTARKQKR